MALARLMGVQPDYTGIDGVRRDTAPESAAMCLAAMGIDLDPSAITERRKAEEAAQAARAVPVAQVVEAGQAGPELPGDWAIELEDGRSLEGRGPLPPLPMGVHRVADRDDAWIVAAPRSLPLPARGWGVTLPLYGLRTEEAGGIGDYRDLEAAVRALAAGGAGFVGINPVHAGFPTDPAAISPYSPSHRRRLSTRHLHIVGAPRLGNGPHLDYPEAERAVRHAAEAAFPGPDAGRAALSEGGADLRRFATHQALSEVEGPYWDSWDPALRDPEGPAVAAFAARNGDRIGLHAWLQTAAEAQLSAAAKAGAGMAHGLYLDLAVGTHPFGAETWAEPGIFASGVSLGAPPDAFSPDGQVWNLAPFAPMALARSGFRALAETLRYQFRFARLLRIDHILGFERAFWAPTDRSVPGAYVAMPRAAMLAVVRIEAARAGATVVGEDLGNIPGGLREALAAAGILGCRLAMFEPEETPDAYPERAMTSFGTHDLPTYAGWREGRDIAARAHIGLIRADSASAEQARRQEEVARLHRTLGGDGADRVHAHLAASGSRLVAVQVEDALGLADQPNLPGTVACYPNWRQRLPVAAEDLGADPGIRRAAEVMAANGR